MTNEELRWQAALLDGWIQYYTAGTSDTLFWSKAVVTDYGAYSLTSNDLPDYFSDLWAAMELWARIPDPKIMQWAGELVILEWGKGNRLEGLDMARLFVEAFILWKEAEGVPDAGTYYNGGSSGFWEDNFL